MADKKKIGASIVLDGEKEFKSAVTDCNKKLTSMRSELGLVKEKYAENANSLEALSTKHDSLAKVLQLQKNKLEATKAGYDHALASQNKVGSGLTKLKAEYQKAQEQMDKMKKSGTATDEELDKQQKTIDELSEAIKKGERNYESAGNRVENWKNKLNTAEAQTIRANRALIQNDKYMEEAKRSTTQCATSIDQYGKKLKTVKVDVSEFGNSSKDAINELASTIVAAGLADKVEDIAETLFDCAEAADAFETASAKVSTIADTSKVSMSELNKQMLDLSNSTGKGVSDIAESTYQAISASVDTANAVSTVEEATKLATGGFTDTTTAIDGLTTVVNSYGDKVKDVSEVSDLFVTVQNKGKTTVGDLASSIGKVATKAANYNVSLQDLGASYIEITKRGVETSEATTNINSLLKELSKNGSDASIILKNKTGKTFAELMDSGESLADVIDILSKSVGGDATAFGNLFSRQEAAQAATILLRTGTKEYNKTLKEVKDSAGATAKAYETMTDTSEHAKEKMVNGIENLKIAIGTELNKSLEGMYESGEKAISWATKFVQDNPKVVSAIVSVTAALGTLTAAFAGFSILKTITPMVTAFTTALSANPIGLAAVALGTVTTALVTYSATQETAKTKIEQAAEADQQYIKGLNEKHKALQESIQQTQSNFEATKSETITVERLVDRLKNLNSIQNKTADQKAEIKRISDQLKDKIPQIAAAYDEETGAINLTNKQMNKLVNNYKRVALAAVVQSQLTEAGKEALEAQERLNDASEKAKECKKKQTKAQEEYNKALKKAQDLSKSEGGVSVTGAVSNDMIKAQQAVQKAAKGVEAAEKSYKDAQDSVKAYKDDLNKVNKMMDTANSFIKKYSDSTKKQKNDTENSGKAAKKASQEYKKLGNTFNTAVTKMNASGNSVAKSTETAFNSAVKIAKKTGTKIPAGLAAGLKDGSKSPETAVIELKKAINKKLLELSNNARKQGAYIPEKLTDGISENLEDPANAYEQINKQIKKRAESMQKKLNKVGINISDGMKKSFEKGGQNALDAISNANTKITNLMNAAGVNSVQGLLNGVNSKKAAVIKAYEDLGDAADKAFKKKLDIHSPSRVFKKSGVYTVDGLIKGIESKKANLKKTANELGEILINSVQNKIDMKDLKTNGNGYNEKTITKYWKGVVKATKKGTSAHTEALKKYYEARNDLKNKKNEILRDYKSTYKEYISDLKNSIKELNQTYKESVSSTKQSIMSSYSLFSDVKITKTDDANGLIVNLQRQVETIDSWRKNLQKLRDRGVSESLISEIEALGVTSAGDVETLANMSDKQLKQYQSYYNKKNSLAEAEAKKENEALKKQTDSKIKKLDAEFSKKIANLTKKRNREMKALGLSLAKKFTEGIISGSSSAHKAIENMTGQKSKKVKKSSSSSRVKSEKIINYSSSKVVSKANTDYTGLGYVQNLQKETRNLTDIIKKNLPTKDSISSVTARVNTGVVNNTNAEPVQLNLLMDSKMVASATFNHLDLMQGANIRLMQRGISR